MMKRRNILKTSLYVVFLLVMTISSAWANGKSKRPQVDEYGNPIMTMTERNEYKGQDYNGAQTTSLTPTNDIAQRNTYKGMDANGAIIDVKNVGKLYDDKYNKKSCSIETIRKDFLDGATAKNCWYCNIVSTMTNSFLTAVAESNGIVQTLALLILRYGFLIWLAYYILQQVSSLAPIKISKVLQDILMMGFKVLLATLAVRQGIPLLTEFFIDPVMLLGVDYGQEMLDGLIEANIGSGGAS
ncbi:MAG: hypothetical protein J6N45_09935 [Alphaproteobacteria bacterium]|nr:hypothetical protein [Alphaproteobacteria bacterium]